ncbi:erythronate-4-phosphate dehydrogenase [Dysgonomonas sp. PFB1-18]|uniref:4-phosphoerythronate dehydrogenase PdxB n=1 Tax=unclassified Dysgonomonas TaxID=2630389 RepID=UPI002474AF1D|nr:MULTISPECIES: 4-phosphoerythronate dehydrogenase PdxB [unclassified Dysgonomonas]MDH6307367.1 erythronate-4-phosphate dehydrogenase [Dysgonomonas sp. PF1-14]MDH6337285.1 erythronate-4-phosphate dehydrogenase [Dysgonomonas sp. PF1-16]MDH6379209.1 erythronate-4-phosphate dehydrogenase [Dysgonomonas sp. PFB1-18]MDH6396153.1 erythronate-4-phosphate dehydrogenase [Dysgonomonas sp. PF1-23]
MKIIADKNIPYLKGIAEYFGEVTYLDGSAFSHETIKNADTLIVRTVTRFDEAILKDTQVKLICSATIGYDHIDTAYCDAHGIVWHNAPGCNSGSVMQYIVSSLIVMARKKGFDLKDKTIGIVGVGNVGKKVARACEILGMKVLLNDPPRERAEGSGQFVSLETIMCESDIITFHTPLIKERTDKTYHLADKAFFTSLEKKPIIINSARGGIVDTEAIKDALKEDVISGAVIDCWENEPLIDIEYLHMVDIATPHIAGYSADGKANATRMSLESVAEFYNLDKNPVSEIKVPEPENPVIDLNTFPDSDNRIYDAILETYNPLGDFNRLLASPDTFKQLRNNYPLRRECFAYRVINALKDERKLLDSLGFM